MDFDVEFSERLTDGNFSPASVFSKFCKEGTLLRMDEILTGLQSFLVLSYVGPSLSGIYNPFKQI